MWVALQPEVGWLYGGVGIPVGFRLSERAWLHLAPSVGYRLLRTVDVPFGLSYAGPKGLTISGEVAFAYGPETDLGLIGNVPNGRASFMLGYRFGPRKQ